MNKWDLPLVPPDPARLTGPEVGQVVRYRAPSYKRWDGLLMRVVERFYHWSPEVVRYEYGVAVARGYLHYDWTVVEWPELSRDGTVRWSTMVVNDSSLETP